VEEIRDETREEIREDLMEETQEVIREEIQSELYKRKRATPFGNLVRRRRTSIGSLGS